jgi:hypothetical protein
MQHFYDGQIRRYITQIVRLMSNFSYQDGAGQLTQVPVMYGDITRQVGHILRDNSENKIPSAPRMAVYITGLEMDSARLSDSSYVSKVNIRERAYDADGKEYLNTEGKNYTVERLMPTPYTLSVNVDLWTSNTDQKLQLMEQILMLFNPSLEIQTTDNYIDWTSLSVVNLANIGFSTRSIPVGTETEIDVAQLGFTTPIYISPPTKVKRLGVVTSIVQSIYDESRGTIELAQSTPELQAYADTSVPKADIRTGVFVTPTGEIGRQNNNLGAIKDNATNVINNTFKDYGLLVMGTSAKLIRRGVVGSVQWDAYIKALPEIFEQGITEIRLSRKDRTTEIAGTVAINSTSPTELIVNWDVDTLPSDTVFTGPTGDANKIHYIVDPTKTSPVNLKTSGYRFLLLDSGIGDGINTDGADDWKNTDGTDFVAGANDIVEWNGTAWSVVFDSSTYVGTAYTSNLNTGVQYKWDNGEWILSFEGEYPNGTWRLKF